MTTNSGWGQPCTPSVLQLSHGAVGRQYAEVPDERSPRQPRISDDHGATVTLASIPVFTEPRGTATAVAVACEPASSHHCVV